MNWTKEELDALCEKVIGACVRVHQHLGPGLLEQVYKEALKIEFKKQGLHYDAEFNIHAEYDGVNLGVAYRGDFLVENVLILEVKSVEELTPVFVAQTINYVTLTKKQTALLVNFNTLKLTDGIRRLFPKRRIL